MKAEDLKEGMLIYSASYDGEFICFNEYYVGSNYPDKGYFKDLDWKSFYYSRLEHFAPSEKEAVKILINRLTQEYEKLK